MLNYWTHILLSEETTLRKTIYCLVLDNVLGATTETVNTMVVAKEKESKGGLSKHGGFLGHWIIIYVAIMVDICYRMPICFRMYNKRKEEEE